MLKTQENGIAESATAQRHRIADFALHRISDFPVGSLQSRAAARAKLDAIEAARGPVITIDAGEKKKPKGKAYAREYGRMNVLYWRLKERPARREECLGDRFALTFPSWFVPVRGEVEPFEKLIEERAFRIRERIREEAYKAEACDAPEEQVAAIAAEFGITTEDVELVYEGSSWASMPR